MDSKSVMEFEAAVLRGTASLPVEVESLTVTEVNGQRSLIIKIRRDLSVNLRSYTIAYCFCAEPVEDVADLSSFRRKTYSEENINTQRVIYFTGRLPASLEIHGCGAYIAGVEYEDGSVETFENTDYITPGAEEVPFDDGIEWAENAEDYAAFLSGSTEADYTATPFADPASDDYPASPWDSADAGMGAAMGDSASQKRGGQGAAGDSRPGSDRPKAKAANGARTEANNGAKPKTDSASKTQSKAEAKRKAVTLAIVAGIVICFVGAGVFGLLSYSKSATAATVNSLMDSERFTEAYKIAEYKKLDELRLDVARRAMKHYLDSGDIKSAYIFGELAGQASEVTDAALVMVASLGEEALGTDAFAVALKSPDAAKADGAISDLASTLADAGNYEKAMNATLFMADDALRTERANSIFYRGISYYTERGQYENAAALIKRYGSTRSYDGSVDDDTVSDAVAYCAENSDSASAILLAKYFNHDFSGIEVAPGDHSVRSALSEIYPLLTDEQRRAYHSNVLGYCKEAFFIENGAIEGTDITDAVGTDTYEFRTAVLHADGRVSMLDNGGHNETDEIPADLRAVQVVCGLHHTVALRADGSCVAFGSNDYGQCNVSEWKGIVKLAAGRYFTLGLRSDGTVVACGSNVETQGNTGDYRNVVDIGACDQTAVMLFADGSVHVQGDVTMGLYEANSLEGVVEMSCRVNTIVVRLSDGGYRIICAADGDCAAGDAKNLDGAQAFCAGSTSVAYIDRNGALHIMGDGAPKDRG